MIGTAMLTALWLMPVCTLISFGITSLCVEVGTLIALPPFRKPPPIHWTDRARLVYPARKTISISMFVMPVLMAAAWDTVARTMKLPSFAGMVPMIFLGSLCGVWSVGFHTERRIRGGNLAVNDWLHNLLTTLLIRLPVVGPLFVVPYISPTQLNQKAIWIWAIGTLIVVFGLAGGGYLLACVFNCYHPASPRLAAIVKNVATRNSMKTPVVYERKSIWANAFAAIFFNAIVVDERTLSVLCDDELSAIISHEAAHLCERRIDVVLRCLGGLAILLPIITFRSLVNPYPLSVPILLIVMLLGVRLTHSIGRKLEVRADRVGHSQQTADGVYARALEKLYEYNLIPAVMSQRYHHPDLYDRLIAAGVKPSYPRPSLPLKQKTQKGVIGAILMAIILLWILTAVFGPVQSELIIIRPLPTTESPT